MLKANEIDGKINEKFRFFEKIDEEVKEFTPIKQSNLALYQKYMETQNTRNSLSSNKQPASTKKYNFINLKNSHQYKISNNTYHEDNFNTTKVTSDTFSNIKLNDLKKQVKSRKSRTKSKDKPPVVVLSQRSLKIGERLYNNTESINQKLIKTKEKINLEYSYSYTPILSPYANKVTRDPSKFSNRLYPSFKIESIPKIYNNRTRNRSTNHLMITSSNNNYLSRSIKSIELNESKIYSRPNENKKEYNEHLVFKPSLNKISLKMAKNIGSSFERLTRERIRKNSLNCSSETGTLSTSNLKKLSRSSMNLNKTCVDKKLGHSLYERAQKNLKEKREKIKYKRINEQNEYMNYGYIPDLSLSRTFSPSKLTSGKVKQYERAMLWEKTRQIKNEKLKKVLNEHITFKPCMYNNKDVVDDENFISKHITQIMTYVSRKQKSLDLQKKKEDLQVKLFEKGKNYKVKPTIIKEFDLSFAHNNLKDKNRIIELNKKRNNLKTKTFFSENTLETYDKQSNANNNNLNTLDKYLVENQFSEAVGYLHEHLHNLR